MPNINTLKESRFLKKEDCGASGILVTIRGDEMINVAQEGAPEEFKLCLRFDESDKPMVLNSTNAQIIARIIGSDETENWVGHKIVLYNDPGVSFGGKVLGGIRARAPRNQSAPVPMSRQVSPPARMPTNKIAEMPSDTGSEDVPF